MHDGVRALKRVAMFAGSLSSSDVVAQGKMLWQTPYSMPVPQAAACPLCYVQLLEVSSNYFLFQVPTVSASLTLPVPLLLCLQGLPQGRLLAYYPHNLPLQSCMCSCW